MPSLIPDFATLERTLAGLPVVKHRAREVVLTAGSKTSVLLFLKSGTVEVVKDGVQIASVNAPGSVFGEQAILLDQPHTADVRTVEQSLSSMSPMRRRFLLAIQPSSSTSPRCLRDGLTRPTDGLSRLSASYKPASLPA